VLAAAATLGMLLGMPATADEGAAPDLKRLTLEELTNLEVSSVSKTPEPVGGAPAAVYVITGEDVRRSGSTTLAEVLRLAPNLQVGRIDAGGYAISARGFNNIASNKLLVLIDGRTVYTPLYSGVFWDTQTIAPSEIARIEVVSGPGGTLWGSNAVNGVINVVSHDSDETQGAMVRLSGGNADWNGVAQYGGRISDNLTYRIYGGALRQGHTLTATGADAQDFWKSYQGGFRADYKQDADTLTLQGDLSDGVNMPSSTSRIDLRSGNVLGRWRRTLGDGSSFEVQAYYDHAARVIQNGIRDAVDTYDIAAQHNFVWGERHRVIWGGGYRVSSDRLTPGVRTSFLVPEKRTLQLGNVFVHDTIALASTLKLGVGLKVESNSYTGIEYMPDARLSWQVTPATMLWAAVSRAMRTPSRFDRDLFNTGILAGGPGFQSEELIAYEAGYRSQLAPNATLSISVFYNDYDRLRTAEPPFPLTLQNRMEGHTYGVEVWAAYEPLPWWRLKGGVTALHKAIRLEPGSASFFGIQVEGNDPDHQFSLRSEMNLTERLEFDTSVRAVGSLPNPAVPAYAAVDARIGWRVSDTVQLSISAFNLLNAHHTEFIASSPPRRDIRRTVYATARWSM
jgi:iron complex outermembrane receptor protein